jgi:phenylacetic acid degradation operon negative regulatory protein
MPRAEETNFAAVPGEPPRARELEPILAYLNAGPSRTWSLIITLFGDAIVPRGRAIWLGTLLEIFRALDIGDGVVRTAMSRLTADGWLERSKLGRNSYYRLADAGAADFACASDKIYARRPPGWSGRFDLIVVDPPSDPSLETRVRAAGFGSLAGHLWIAPGGADLDAVDPDRAAIRLVISGEAADLSALAARAWDLQATARAYARFIDVFAPLGRALKEGLALSDRDALVARTLLIHAWRRIVLRDPLLPPEVLPIDWPGTPARVLCGSIYRRILAGSEAWLDANAIGEDGASLPDNPALVGARFRD